MNIQSNDRRILTVFIFALGAMMVWGYVSGSVGKLFQPRSPEEKAAAEKRSLDHIFGSDQGFDPAADNITATAEGAQDNLSWKILAHAKLHMAKASDSVPAGVDFSPEVQKLDGSDVTITGYMFPLQASGEQSHFLLSAYPPSCPYCLPGGPTELIDITDSDPIKFTYEAITVHGAFHLLRDDALKDGMFYRMTHIYRRKSS